MEHKVEATATGLRINASVPPAKRDTLLEELGKCAAGTCSCPSPQYGKLESIEVQPDPAGVTVELRVKPGETLDSADVEACLEHTGRKIGP